MLITGGSGYLGHYLLGKYLGSYCVGRNTYKNSPLLRCDLQNLETLNKLIQRGDLVYHLAANTRIHLLSKNLELAIRDNLVTSINVFRSCLRHENEIVFTSTKSIHDRPLNEYSLSKLMSEEAAKFYAEKGLPVKIVRLASVYGPELPEGKVMSDLAKKILKRNSVPIVNSEREEYFIHAHDVMKGLEIAREADSAKPYELGPFQGIKIIKLARIIANLLERDIEFIPDGKGNNYIAQPCKHLSSLGWEEEITLEEGLREALKNPRWPQKR